MGDAVRLPALEDIGVGRYGPPPPPPPPASALPPPPPPASASARAARRSETLPAREWPRLDAREPAGMQGWDFRVSGPYNPKP
jgi:hypothetical protein